LRDAASRKGWLAAIVRNEAFRYYARPRPDPTDEVERFEGHEDELVVSTVDRADLEALRGHGWEVVSPLEAAATPQAFRSYLQGSGAEFSVAQGVYAEGRTGWFSDRTAAYLASGRPALVQETGIGGELLRGEGLLAFSSLGEAEAEMRRIVAEPSRHGEAARALAERHLDSDLVLSRLLDMVCG